MDSHVNRRNLPGTNYKYLSQKYINGTEAPKHYEVNPFNHN